MLRLCFAVLVALTTILPTTTVSVTAASGGGDRTIYMRHTHTGDVGKFTFRRNGEYDKKVLQQLNVFLADWRTKEPTKMDPALFDLLWTVYQEVGATEPINIVSSYRSPKTNKMLRSKSSGVAENSQHMKGKAIDFYIPGIKLSTLRETVMRHQVGGIGYYPTSGSPFVHADTGSVRAWPRMTRAQLKKVFPDGKTLHLPTDGKPLSSSGRAYAEAEWKKCHTVPCRGSVITTMPSMPAIMVADETGNIAPIPLDRPQRLYGGDTPGIMMASLDQEPTQRTVSTIDVAPLPLARPAALGGTMQTAAIDPNEIIPFPAQRPARFGGPSGALQAIDNTVPQPRVLMTPKGGSDMMTAYAPGNTALKMLIEGNDTPITSALKPGVDADMITASLGGAENALGGLFDTTFNAISGSSSATAAAAVKAAVLDRQPIESIKTRPVELIAPEIDHVNETLTMPVLMSDGHFAELYEAEGYLDKEAELGPMAGRMAFLPDLGQPLDYDQFVTNAPLLVAAR